MFSEATTRMTRNNVALLGIALSLTLFSPTLHAADVHSYAQEIQRDVAENKVYLLEKIRQKVTIPSEKTVLEALLSEDGPKAITLYKKQLKEYPDPAVDKISTSRLAAYTLALEGNSAPMSKRSIQQQSAKPQPPAVIEEPVKEPEQHSYKPEAKTSTALIQKEDSTKQSSTAHINTFNPSEETPGLKKVVTTPKSSTLQFGSFSTRQNAETLADKIAQYAPVEIVQKGQIYRVQLKQHFSSKEEAAAAAKKLPVKAIVIPSV